MWWCCGGGRKGSAGSCGGGEGEWVERGEWGGGEGRELRGGGLVFILLYSEIKDRCIEVEVGPCEEYG